MAPKWSDDLNMKFIQLYKAHTCLWDQENTLYKNKEARLTALRSIAENLNIQGFGVNEVKAKIKAFRGTFNIEYAKQKNSEHSNEVYVPTLKWFNLMKEVMVGRRSRNSKRSSICGSSDTPTNDLEITVVPAFEDGAVVEHVIEENQTTQLETQAFTTPTGSQNQTCAGNQPAKMKRSKIPQIPLTTCELKYISDSDTRDSGGEGWDMYSNHVSSQLDMSTPAVQQVKRKQTDHCYDAPTEGHAGIKGSERDDHSVYGEYLASRMRKIQNPKRLCVLKNQIDNLVFAAEMEEFSDMTDG